MTATLNGAPVVICDLHLPQEGAWTADVDADLTEVPASASLVILGRRYTGAVARGAFAGSLCRLRVVGGAGKLLSVLQPKHYRNPQPASAILADILREAGETLSATAQAATLAQQLAKWTRVLAPARDQLQHLCAALGATWRVLPDGSIWVGVYNFSAAPATADGAVLIEAQGETGRRVVAAEDAPWEPGQSLQGWKIGSVRHVVTKGASRTTLAEYQAPGLRGSIEGELARAGVAFSRSVPGRAVAQDADGTLQVQPDDATFPPMTGVPIRTGIPDAKYTIAPGARVLLEFEGGSPQAPVVTAWGQSTATEITLGGDSAVAAARLGDAVSLGTIVFATAGPGLLTGTFTPPGGAPLPFTLGTVIPLTGKITSGSPLLKVK